MLTKCVDEMKVPLNQITEYQVSMYQQLGKLYVRIILFATIDECQWYNGMGKSNTCKKNARPKKTETFIWHDIQRVWQERC